MSTALASTIALALYAAALVPFIALASSTNAKPVFAACVAIILAVAMYHTGLLQQSSLAPTDIAIRAVVPADDEACRKIRGLAEEAGLRVDRTDLAAPKIVGPGAEQVPPEVNDVLINCFEVQSAAPTDERPADEPFPLEQPFE